MVNSAQFIIDFVKPKCDGDIIPSMIDPFAGSGGFILQAKKITGVKSENIFAHENDDKIYKFLKFNSNIANLQLDNIDLYILV